MVFKRDDPPYKSEVVREVGENVLYMNYLGAKDSPSLIDSPSCMERTINMLIESPNISRVVFVQNKNYAYNLKQISLLAEVANIYNYITKQEKILDTKKLILKRCNKCLPQREHAIKQVILGLLKKDPIGSYVEAKRFLREERINSKRFPKNCIYCEKRFIRLLEKIVDILSETGMIHKTNLDGHHIGNRKVYSK